MTVTADISLRAGFEVHQIISRAFQPSLQIDGSFIRVDSSTASAQLLAAVRQLHAHVVAFEDNAAIGSLVQSARDAAEREDVGEAT